MVVHAQLHIFHGNAHNDSDKADFILPVNVWSQHIF